MKARHVTNNHASHQVSRAVSAPGPFAPLNVESPRADAARLAKTSLRRGYSLIELMVVVSIITVLFGMVGVVFHRLFLSEQLATRAALTEQSVSWLAVRFRSDVHGSTAVLPEAVDGTTRAVKLLHGDTGWVKHFPAIVYTAREGDVLREQFDADGKLLNREVYRLPECRVSFPDQPENVDGVMLSLAIERQGSTVTPQPQATRPYRSLVIEALLSRDDHLARGLSLKSPEPVKEEPK